MDLGRKGSNEHAEKQKLEKELKCKDCDYITNGKANLKRHQEAIHKGVRHTYNLCGKQFTCKSKVEEHKKSIHLLQKICDLCGYKAQCKGDLTKHKKSIHEEKKYSCLKSKV